MLSAVVTAKAQENCGFPGVAPGRVCPVTANPGLSLRDRGREREHILLRPSCRYVCRHSRVRIRLGDRRRLGNAAAAALGRRHAPRDHALDPDTIPGLLATRIPGGVRRARHRDRWALY